MHLATDTAPVPPPEPDPDRRYVLYVHIPFCESLCPFCSFHRVLHRYPQSLDYFDALRREIRLYAAAGFVFDAVYIGGGTPTILPGELCRTIAQIRDQFAVREIAVETNPNHLQRDIVARLRDAGVKRLSVGVQSFDDALLRKMNRYVPYGGAESIKERLLETQGCFETLNVDMIFNLPHQTAESLENDLAVLTELIRVDQISYYPLMTTPATKAIMATTMGSPTTASERRYYDKIVATLSRDYQASTAWCFSRGGRMIDEYIVDRDEYVGVGSGAFSYVDGTIYSNTFSIQWYIDAISEGRASIAGKRPLADSEQMRYDLLMKLFGLSVSKRTLEQKHDGKFFRSLRKEIGFFRLLGAITEDDESLRLTRKGMYLWVVMMREFFSGVNLLRDDMRTGTVGELSASTGTGNQ